MRHLPFSNVPPILARCLATALVAAAFFTVAAATVRAQVSIDIVLPRRSYILYEPIVATVAITNNAGRDLQFADADGKQWFNVEVSTIDERLIPPYDPFYKLNPLTVPSGQTVKRKIDLTPIFPIRDMGTLKIRASVYQADTEKFYTSDYINFDLTEGRTIWNQVVGDGQGGVRRMSLLTHHLFDKMLLYVRVRDQDGPNIYATQSIGRVLISGQEPQAFLDKRNTLHIVHEAVPRGFYYTTVNLDGEVISQKVFTSEGRDRPHLIKLASGEVDIRGGRAQTTTASAAEAVSPNRDFRGPGQAKLSDRPAGLPEATRQKR